MTLRSWAVAKVCLRGKMEKGRLPTLASHPSGKQAKVVLVRTRRAVTTKKESRTFLRGGYLIFFSILNQRVFRCIFLPGASFF